MLDVMNRHSGWCVLVCLVGGGQEIHRGEAGLSEWGIALRGFSNWKIYASPEVLGDRSGGSFSLILEDDPMPARVMKIKEFHLKVSHRSIRAAQTSQWVDAILRGDRVSARNIIDTMSGPPVLSRDISTTRQWLREKRRGLTRAGLVASSGAARLRPDGLEPCTSFLQT